VKPGRFDSTRNNDDVTELAVRDEDFLPVDHKIVAVAARLRADGLEVAAGMRLRHAKRADSLASNHLRQPVTLLLVGTERQDIGRDQVGMDEEARAASADAPKLLEHHNIEQVIEAEPAVFLRDRAAQQALRAGLQPQFARNDALFLPFRVVGDDLFLDEAADGRPPDLVVFREQGAFDHSFCSFKRRRRAALYRAGSSAGSPRAHFAIARQ
jgi:hypothetical protein